MTRRGRVVLFSALALFVLFAAAVVGLVMGTQTEYGRERVRQVIASALQRGIHGKVYVGRISDGFFTGVTIDSFSIRDDDDSLFIAAGRVSVKYDLRDLLDRRILLHNVHAEHPVVHLRQHENGEWNFRRVFRSNNKKPTPKSPERNFGEYVIIDSAWVRDGALMLTLPWHPSPHLHGAARDSAIRFELARKDHEIRRTSEGFTRTWRWTRANALAVRARLADPDSAGTAFRFTEVSVAEADPPFLFRNVRGELKQRGDSIWVDVPHFDLPGSTGHGTGKIVWGSDLPIRYNLHVIGDSVSMRDIAWIYPTLPNTGGGRTILDIKSQPKNLHLIDYILTEMDMRSTRSRLLGRMTFELGADTLGVKDVQLTAAPVNFDLLRTLNGKPFPYDWQGNLTGTVKASGGNVGRFKVEEAKIDFADANVPGALTRGSAAGELDIFAPALTAFHGFKVNVETMDLRTLRYLNKEFPHLDGTISGVATLDSSWLDVRFRDADLVHHDGPGPVSRATGSGRVTWGEQYLTYDINMVADSVSFTTMQRSYPYLPLRGSFAGPVLVQGESPDLHVVASLSNAAGTITYDGQMDMDPMVYGAHGSGTFLNADLRRWLDQRTVPHTNLSGSYAVDLSGDSLSTLRGTMAVHTTPSTVGETRLAASGASLRFDAGMLFVDTASVQTADGKLDASGTVALVPYRTGTLDYRVTLASLAEAGRLAGMTGKTPISGSGSIVGQMTGSIDTLQLQGTLDGRDVAYGTFKAKRATGSMLLRDVTRASSGSLTLALDTITTSLFPFTHVATSVRIDDPKHFAFSAEARGPESIRATASGTAALGDSSTTLHVDSARVSVDSANSYALTAPATVVADASAVTVDSVLFARARGGSVALRALRMAGDSIRGSLRTSDLDLAMLQLFGSRVTGMHGQLTANVDVDGTIHAPKLSGAITLENGSIYVPSVGGRYGNIVADIALLGDTVLVRRLVLETNRERRGTLAVDGTVVLGGPGTDPVLGLRAIAKNFRVVDKRGLAVLDISTSQPITLTGPVDGTVVRGGILVDRGTVSIPELTRKRVVNLNDPELYDVIDTTLAQDRALVPGPPSEFTKHLRLEGVGIDIGDDVWLRSAEANIKLGGSLNVTLGSGADERSQLALQGVLRAVRGTYRLNIVPLVQPTFDVEAGTIRFFGTPGFDPALNITAINTVRKPAQSVTHQDVRIRATIGGTLLAPTLTLSSADNLPLTQSDLLSYLITGEPAFALDYTSQTYVNQLAAVAIRSAGNVISSAIPRSVFDVVELQTAGAQDPTAAAQRLENPTLYNLLNTRAVLGKQLNNNLFLNFSTGFCAENFRNNLGFRLEYRFNRVYRLLFGVEPGSSELTCARSGAAQSIQQTPPQFGIDFYRSWRF